MASLFNTKISNTYVGLLKMSDNLILSSSLREISDGSGNGAGVYLNTSGDLKATGILEFGSLKDTGESITISKFVDEADGIANNDNDTSIPTSAAIVDYVASRITLEDLDFSGDSGTGSVDLDSQTFAIVGTANEIETSAGSQQLQIGLPSNVTITSNLQINGLLKGNNNIVIKDTSDRTMAAFYGGDKSELYFNDSKKLETTSDGATITGGLTATGSSTFTSASFSGTITGVANLSDGSTAVTQSINDNSTKIATTAYVDASVDTTDTLSEILAIGNTTGGTNIAVSANDDITFTDTSKAVFGDGNDLQIYHINNSIIYNTTGDLVFEQIADDRDIVFKSDDGSGGSTEYFKLDGSNAKTTFSRNYQALDNVKAQFGDSNDLQIYHDGSNSYIKDLGTGNLIIQGTQLRIQDQNGENFLVADQNGYVQLYYDNSAKLATSSTGVTVTGVAVADGLDVGDNEKIRLGASQDLEIYHDASNSYIVDTGTGDLNIQADNNINIKKAGGGETKAVFTSDGAVELYYDNIKRFETSAGGTINTGTFDSTGTISVTGASNNIKVGTDTGKFMAGASNDLQIYHDGSNSYIKDNGTGNLKIQASTEINLQATSGESFIDMFENGAVKLYYDNSAKLETTTSGIDITGTSASNSILVNGGADARVKVLATTTGARLDLQTDSHHRFLQTIESDGRFRLYNQTSGTEQIAVSSSGDTTFYGDISVVKDIPSIDLVDTNSDDDFRIRNNNGVFEVLDTTNTGVRFKIDSDGHSQVTGNLQVDGNQVITGDLTVNGTTTTVNTEHFNVEDPLISMAKDNAANSVDIGFYGRYNDGSDKYLGLFADASDSNNFKLFKGTGTEPTTTVDTSATGYVAASLTLDSLNSNNIYNGEYIYHSNNTSTNIRFLTDRMLLTSGGGAVVDLHSNGQLYFTGASTFYNNITLSGASSPKIRTTDTTNTVTTKIMSDDTSGFVGTETNHDLSFLINNNQKALLDTDGNFAIGGTNNGSSKLSVHGAGIDNISSGDANSLRFRFYNGSTFQSGIQAVLNTGGMIAGAVAGDMAIRSQSQILFATGGNTERLKLDSSGNAFFAENVSLLDSKNLKLGTSSDLQLFHNGSNSHIQNATGDLYIENLADDKQIIFRCDDGSGGFETYFALEGASGGSNPFTVWPDNAYIALGSNHDTTIHNTGSEAQINNYTGSLTITQHQDDGNIVFNCDNGSGGTTEYLRLDGGNPTIVFSKSSIHTDNIKAYFGTGLDLELYHDGANSYIETGTGSAGDFYIKAQGSNHDLYLQATDDIFIRPQGGENGIKVLGDAGVEVYYDNSLKFKTISTGTVTTGYSRADAFANQTSDTYSRIFAPTGAAFNGSSSTHTGALTFVLPQVGVNCMMTIKIRVFDYSTDESFDVNVAGYYYTGNNWTRTSAWIDSSPIDDLNYNVRFGVRDSDGRGVISIGETTTTWSYVKFGVVEIVPAHSNASAEAWADNWEATILTSFTGYTMQTSRSNLQVNNFIRNGSNLYYTRGDVTSGSSTVDAAGSVTLKNNGIIRGVLASGTVADTIINAVSGVSNGFQITNDSSNNQEYKFHNNGGNLSVHIDNVGDLKIGNSNRTDARVVVTGDNSGTNPAATAHMASALVLNNGQATDGAFSGIDFNNGNTLVTGRIVGIHTDQSARHGDIAFLTHNGTALTERMRFKHTGEARFGWNSGTYTNAQTIAQFGNTVVTDEYGISLSSTGDALSGYFGSNVHYDNGSFSKPNSNRSSGFFEISNTTASGKGSSFKFMTATKGSNSIVQRFEIDENSQMTYGDVKERLFAVASLDTTGYDVATITGGGNGSSAQIEFVGMGGTSGIVDVVYSCSNQGGNWYAYKKERQSPSLVDVDVSGHGTTTLTFTFKSLSGTQGYTPRVTMKGSPIGLVTF